MRLVNRSRAPSASTRLSFTRGARTGHVPAPQVTVRSCARPFRTTSRCPSASRVSANRSMYSVTSASRAVINIRRAPSRANMSSVGGTTRGPSSPPLPTPSPADTVVGASATAGLSSFLLSGTVSMGGVSFPPALPARVSCVVHNGRIRHLPHAAIHNFRLYLTRRFPAILQPP